MKTFLQLAKAPHIWRNAIKVSLVVGTLLNIINQSGRVLDDAPISWWQVDMNHLVPYCVATFSAVKNEMNHRDRS